MNRSVNRRTFLKGLAKLGAAGILLDSFLDKIIYGHIKKLLAQEADTYKYLGLYIPGGLFRVGCDCPLYQKDSEKEQLVTNPMVATKWAISSDGLYDITGTHRYELDKVSGLYLPPVWNSHTDLTSLADNSLFITGIGASPVHPFRYKQFTPSLGTPGVHAIPSIIDSSKTFNCISWGSNMSSIPFEHPDNILPVFAIGDTPSNIDDAKNIFESLMAPFNNEDVQTFINEDSGLEDKIKSALEKIASINKNVNINAENLLKDTSSAIDQIKYGVETFISTFGDNYDIYGDLISEVLANDGSYQIPGLEEKEINWSTSLSSSDYKEGYPIGYRDSELDLRDFIASRTNYTLQTSMAMADTLLSAGLTNSLLLSTGAMDDIGIDGHDMGAIGSIYFYPKYYQTILACVAKLKVSLGDSFNKTVIHLASEFGRSARANGSGSDHADSNNTTIISGMISGAKIKDKTDKTGNSSGNYQGSWGQSDGSINEKDIHSTIAGMFDQDSFFSAYDPLWNKDS